MNLHKNPIPLVSLGGLLLALSSPLTAQQLIGLEDGTPGGGAQVAVRRVHPGSCGTMARCVPLPGGSALTSIPSIKGGVALDKSHNVWFTTGTMLYEVDSSCGSVGSRTISGNAWTGRS